MNRSKQVVVLCHCILNSNAKVFPLGTYPGVLAKAVMPFIEQGVGLIQLPCPESILMGLRRWGMTKEQYAHSSYRRSCRKLITPVLDQLEAHSAAGHEILGIVGVDGSPNCGVTLTCEGFCGGEASDLSHVARQVEKLKMVKGRGVFIEEISRELDKRGLDVPFLAIDESDPGSIKS